MILELDDVRAWLAAHGADADYVQSATIKISAGLVAELELLEYDRGPGGIVVEPGLTSPRLILTTRPLLSLPALSASAADAPRARPPVGLVDLATAADIMRHATDADPVEP